jgi:uncharacterized protein YbjT (DUF2867 family)
MATDTIAITGANGQLGKSLLARLSQSSGEPVRALVRSERARDQVVSACPRPTPDVRIVDYRGADEMAEALRGASGVIHLVGIIKEGRGATYVNAHEDSCRVLAAAAQAVGVERIVYLSILGGGPNTSNPCLASKGRAERILLDGPVPTTVLRVPMVLGGDDHASAALKRQAQEKSTRLVDGGATLQQPIDVRDVVNAILAALSLAAEENGALDLGGPETLSHRELVLRCARLWKNVPRIRSFPKPLAALAVRMLERIHPNPPITFAMFDILQHDDRTDPAVAHEILGIELTPLDKTLADYIGPRGESLS